MKKTSFVLGSIFSFLSITAFGQNPNDQVLKINDSIYKVKDFERLYTKNLDLITDANQKDIHNYLDLFILYKLKVQKAYELGLNDKESFKEELMVHRNQLAEKYFINEDKLNALVDEAIQRDKEEVNASHILVKVSKSASKEDVQKAYDKALAIREELLKGGNFEQLAQEKSDDLSARENKGNLGFFVPFRMIYEFETGAYTTKVGEISMPIRSEFGFHLIKVNERRVRAQARDVSHIFIQKTDDLTADQLAKKANQVYTLLKKGEDFGEMAIEYSDDASSKLKRGEMGKFSEHNLDIPNVGSLVYALKEGEFTAPILSNYGYHIFQVTKIYPYPSDQEQYQAFLRKVKSDKRSTILQDDLRDYLIKEYKVTFYKDAIEKAKLVLTPALFTSEEAIKLSYKDTGKTLFDFDLKKKQIKEIDFYRWLDTKVEKYAHFESIETLKNKAFDDFVTQTLRTYYDEQLHIKYPEFHQVVNEYKEGLLLFDLLESVVWKEAKENETALLKLYEEKKEAYRVPKSFNGEFYSFKTKADAYQWREVMAKNPKVSINETHIKGFKKFSGSFDHLNNRLPKDLKMDDIKDGVIQKNGLFYVFNNPVIKASYIPDFEEAKKKVISDYIELYEKDYFNELKKRSKVEINKDVLLQIVSKYNK